MLREARAHPHKQPPRPSRQPAPVARVAARHRVTRADAVLSKPSSERTHHGNHSK
jgi:hypothetical protein